MSANIGDGYAPFLVGLMWCSVLYGITVAQTIFYFRTYHNDTWRLKGMVIFCMTLDTVHIALVCETLHYWYVPCKLPENYIFLPIFRLSFGSSIMVTYGVTSVVQAFYINRVYTLSKKNWYICGTLIALSFIQLGGGIVLTADLFHTTHIADVHGKTSNIGGGIELVATTLCDLMISAALVFYLNKSRTGFKSTENIINRLILFAVNIGLFTSVIALCNLIFWLALPQNFIFAAFHIILSKFYINSLLVTLNSRDSVRSRINGSRSAPDSESAGDFHGVPSNGGAFALTPLPGKA